MKIELSFSLLQLPFQELSLFTISFFLFALGTIAFIVSTISGGGGALLLVPALQMIIGIHHTAPVLNLGNFIGRPARLLIFWKAIHWKTCLYYVPSSLLGAWLSALFFSKVNMDWLQFITGLFLISTVFQFRFGKQKQSFSMRLWWFVPLGFVVSSLGTIIGAVGPILNPFYLNIGLDKEELIATKTANSFFMGIVQISSYAFLGLIEGNYWLYGMALGAGAISGSVIGKRLLSGMKSKTFRQLLLIVIVVSGGLMIIRQLSEGFSS